MNWPLVLLDSISERGSGHTPSQKHPEYWNGGIKWVSLADSHALDRGYIYETAKNISELGIRHSSAVLHPAGTVILSRDAGVGKSAILGDRMAVSQHFIAWRCDEKRLSAKYLYHWLQFEKPEFERVATGSTIKTIGLGHFQKLCIPQPSIAEQKAISNTLDAWDTAIQKTEQLIAAKEQFYKALSSQLLFGLTRFRRYGPSKAKSLHWFSMSCEWPVVEIGQIAREVSVARGHAADLPVLSCTKHDGLVDSLKYFKKQVFSHDTVKYKRVQRGQFAYATNHIEEGSIGYQDLVSEALVSPIYTVFQADAARVDDGYLYKLLKTEKLRQLFAASTNASVDRRGSLRWQEFSRIQIPLPPVDEQRSINEILNTAKSEIVLLKAEVDALKSQKRGLMQKLLTGQWRLPPLEGEHPHA